MTSPQPKPFHAIGFGLHWASDLPLPAFHPAPVCATPDITVDLHPEAKVIPAPPSGDRRIHWLPDGFEYRGDTTCIHAQPRDRLSVHPGPAWNGVTPLALFSTVAGLFLAYRWLIPMHGSAVERDGHAILICGPPGAGKSTTAARMIAAGSRLLSDDLTVLHPNSATGALSVFAGRRSMRLFADTAHTLGPGIALQQPSQPADHKMLVYPPHTDPLQSFPLRTLIVLGRPAGTISPREHATLLAEQLFRPALLRRAGNFRFRLAALLFAAPSLQIVAAPSL